MENFLFPDATDVCTKICGVKSLAQAEAIIDLGVDALGFNFYPKSKRFLDPESADWLSKLSGRTLRIGVFVNAELDLIRTLLDHDLLDWAQLHGDESPRFVENLQDEGWPVFKALGVKDSSSLKRAAEYTGPLLLDAYAPVEYGGSGETMDWQLGAEAVESFPEREIILAGGLQPSNVAQAIKQVRPVAVDVASGVETNPGEKDLALCQQFIDAAKHWSS